MLVTHSFVALLGATTLALASHAALPPANGHAHIHLARSHHRHKSPIRVHHCAKTLPKVGEGLDLEVASVGLSGALGGDEGAVGSLDKRQLGSAADALLRDAASEKKLESAELELSAFSVKRALVLPTATYCVKESDVPEIRTTRLGESVFRGVSSARDCEVKCGGTPGPYMSFTNFVALQDSTKLCWCFAWDVLEFEEMLAKNNVPDKCDSANYGSNDGEYVTVLRTKFDRSQSECYEDQNPSLAPHPTLFVPGATPLAGSCGSSCFKTDTAHVKATKVIEWDPNVVHEDWDTPVWRCERYCATYSADPAYEFFGMIGLRRNFIRCSCYGEPRSNYRHADLVKQIGYRTDQKTCDQEFGSKDGKFMTVQQASAWVTF